MLLTSLITLVLGLLLVIAQLIPNDIIALLMPVVVWLATTAANWIKEKVTGGSFGGTIVVTLIVPVLSLAAAWVAEQILNPGLDFWVLVALGILGTFFNEFIKQWTQTVKGDQSKAATTLSGVKKLG